MCFFFTNFTKFKNFRIEEPPPGWQEEKDKELFRKILTKSKRREIREDQKAAQEETETTNLSSDKENHYRTPVVKDSESSFGAGPKFEEPSLGKIDNPDDSWNDNDNLEDSESTSTEDSGEHDVKFGLQDREESGIIECGGQILLINLIRPSILYTARIPTPCLWKTLQLVFLISPIYYSLSLSFTLKSWCLIQTVSVFRRCIIQGATYSVSESIIFEKSVKCEEASRPSSSDLALRASRGEVNVDDVMLMTSRDQHEDVIPAAKQKCTDVAYVFIQMQAEFLKIFLDALLAF